ncbi:hypothetical protein [Enhydrobacter aerosaccus]|nr:hypothetical protein [Enhydrobacter aerosaccus]
MAVYDRLDLSPTGLVDDVDRGGIGGHELPEGWTLIVLGETEHRLVQHQVLAKLSAGCEVIACNVEEHVMFCSCEQWRNGDRVWRLEHHGDADILGLERFGELPPHLSALEQEHRLHQVADGGKDADVDHIFEVPLALALSIVGVKHDENWPESFELLQWQKPKSSWRFWKH